MTIQEYKEKLDAYLGLEGTLNLIDDGKHSESYSINYNAPTGNPIAVYRLVRSKIHSQPHGWYESGSRTSFLPDFDPDTRKGRELWAKHLAELKAKGM